jgi:hypothetical protein
MLKPSTVTTTIRKVADGAVTATATSAKVNAGGFSSAKAYLNITAASGTTPTLVVKFQDSPNGVDSWVDVATGAFSSQNATGTNSLVLSNVGPFLRAVQTVGGTTPSFTYDLKVSGLN